MLAVTTVDPVHGPLLLNGEPAGAEPAGIIVRDGVANITELGVLPTDDPPLSNVSVKPAPCTELSDVSRRNTLPDVTTSGEGGVEPLSVATSAPDALVPE